MAVWSEQISFINFLQLSAYADISRNDGIVVNFTVISEERVTCEIILSGLRINDFIFPECINGCVVETTINITEPASK